VELRDVHGNLFSVPKSACVDPKFKKSEVQSLEVDSDQVLFLDAAGKLVALPKTVLKCISFTRNS
jgi:hypothetical protein